MLKNSLSIVLVLSILTGYSQNKKRVLFLGNSYTAVNNLPQLVADVALSMNDTVQHDNNTPGGYTLEMHTTNVTSQGKIAAGNWDYVVLQEQSQLPSFPTPQVELDVFPFAEILDSTVNYHNPCAETMFYMTWGRKNGDASNCASWPPVCTYSGMDSLLNLRYQMMADSNQATVSAVGKVWKYIRANYPSIELYQPDESHPSTAGSYAAACCFYTSIFRKNPLLISFDYSLSASEAANIRTAVKAVVYDDLMNYNIGLFDPLASFNYIATTGNTINITNTSANATNFEWDFGDGNSSSTLNPSHTYATSGFYNVSLIASHCGFSDTLILSINTTPTNLEDHFVLSEIIVSPNPTTEVLNINIPFSKENNIRLFDYKGKLIKEYLKVSENTVVNMKELSAGIYLLKIESVEGIVSKKIVKQ